MTETKPYYVQSNSSSKSNTKRQHTYQPQTNYEALLSNFSNNKQITNKQSKGSSSAFQCDKYYIQSLQQQIVELKEQVNYLLQENNRLQQQQDKSLNKIKYQYYQLTKYSVVVQMIQQLKVENLALKQNFQSLKLDFNIQLLPLKQLFNHMIQIPKTQISDIMFLTIQQQNSQLSMLKNKSEILNLERTNLLDTCYKYEDELASLKQKCLKN